MESDTLKNRKPAVAGTFYPADRMNLNHALKNHFAEASNRKNLGYVKALITPHAGYVYSGTVAASAFKQLNPEHKYDNIFLIGSSHNVSFNGAAIFTDGNFETPLGIVTVNLSLAKKLVAENPDVFINDREAHKYEHSLEVQLPFLQHIYNDGFQIVPVVIATNNTTTIKKIAQAFTPYFAENNLFVISTDFSHYPDYESANTVDELTANAIVTNSPATFLTIIESNRKWRIQNLSTSVCGWTSVLTLLNMTYNKPEIAYHKILYRNSGDASFGDKSRVVGYHAIAVTADTATTKKAREEEYLTEAEKETLLHIARVTISEYLETGKIKDAGSSSGITKKLLEPAGAFVTLTRDKKLRGCIGQFNSDKALYRTVQEMAVSAATRDYRFPQVKSKELDDIHIEISVLSPLKPIESIDEIVLGKHGIYIVKDYKSGTYLPQVATQTSWSVEEFVSHCSRDKVGIGWDGWKDAEIYVYEACVFSEQE